MTPIPKKVHVGPYTYKVVIDHAAIAEKSWELKDPVDGFCSPNRQQLLVNTAKSHPGSARYTALHEVVHALLDLTGDAKAWASQEDMEEGFVTRFTPVLLDLLRRNPKLVAYLTA